MLRRKKKDLNEVVESVLNWCEKELKKVGYDLSSSEKESLRSVMINDYGDVMSKNLNPEKVLRDAPSVLTACYYNADLIVRYSFLVVELIKLHKKAPLIRRMFPDNPESYDPSDNLKYVAKIPTSFYEKWKETKHYRNYFKNVIKFARAAEKVLGRFT